MLNKRVTLLISATLLNDLSLGFLMNDCLAMESVKKDEKKEQYAWFDSRLSDLKAPIFSQAIDEIFCSKDLHEGFLKYLNGPFSASLLHKAELLAVAQVFGITGFEGPYLGPDCLFKKFNDAYDMCPGNAVFAHCLAWCFAYGIGIKQDFKRANKLYERAIQENFSCSFNSLANAYREGEGREKDISKAIGLYKKAVKLRNSYAMNSLACLYVNDREGKKNIRKAIELYEEAVKLGNSKAMNNLGCVYGDDWDIKTSIKRAQELYEQAIKLGNSHAMDNLALLLCGNGQGALLCEFEFRESHLLPTFSRKFKELMDNGHVNVQAIIKSFLQKEYKAQFRCLLDKNSESFLKNHRDAIALRYDEILKWDIKKGGANGQKDVFILPNVLLCKIAFSLDPKSFIALSFVSKNFYSLLYRETRTVRPVFQELSTLKKNFLIKVERELLKTESSVLNFKLGSLFEMLFSDAPSKEQFFPLEK